jgi:hypothetical protein
MLHAAGFDQPLQPKYEERTGDVTSVEQIVFARQHRVILDVGAPEGDGRGDSAARQLDAVLMTVGFKCSRELLDALGQLDRGYVIDTAVKVIGWARELTGAHVEHNAYFIDFPANVPDTEEFWMGLVMESVRQFAATGESAVRGGFTAGGAFFLDLLSLPGYGTYQHTYIEMLEHHEELIPLVSDRMTVLHLGGTADAELAGLWQALAGSAVPLAGEDLAGLRVVAEAAIGLPAPEVPVRENRAVINAVRVRAGVGPLAGTVTDVLRVAAELSGADVTLTRPPKFASLPRTQRRLLMGALQAVMRDGGHLADVLPRAEQWKRLAERVHPHEYPQYPGAQLVFAAARGETGARTLASQAEEGFAAGNVVGAANWLTAAPGMLWRAADRILRTAHPADIAPLSEMFAATAPRVSGRVLLSVREHLANRAEHSGAPRVFANSRGRAHVAADTRPVIDRAVITRICEVIDAEISSRLPDVGRLAADPAILGAALPLSGKTAPQGLGVWPRGSVTPVGGLDVLRFFIYWRQAHRRTDFDLSAVFTDEKFAGNEWVSYTSLRTRAARHSGDITDASHGAAEFIDVDLPALGLGYVIPQVFVFGGEGFDEVAENHFGFMTRGQGQFGAPFEPRTVRLRQALTGDARVAMPVLFFRGDDGRWYAKWLHMRLNAQLHTWGGARVEENRDATVNLARAIMTREYLRVSYLVDLLRAKASGLDGDGPVTYIGVEQPEDLPEGSVVYTLADLGQLIPA